jgi:hypothetical protein
MFHDSVESVELVEVLASPPHNVHYGRKWEIMPALCQR